MRALTVWNPWAVMLAEGIKTCETRGHAFPKRYLGQRIAIHAAKTEQGLELVDPIHSPVEKAMQEHFGGFEWHRRIPFGMVVATAVISRSIYLPHTQKERMELGIELAQRFAADEDYGDFTPGRHAWLLESVQKLEHPVPARGHQGLWQWDESEMSEDDRRRLIIRDVVWRRRGLLRRLAEE